MIQNFFFIIPEKFSRIFILNDPVFVYFTTNIKYLQNSLQTNRNGRRVKLNLNCASTNFAFPSNYYEFVPNVAMRNSRNALARVCRKEAVPREIRFPWIACCEHETI